ncbi:MAG: 4-hydroxy-3-methylbut-2-enyl diphosphate reductase [Candidatus Moranbacteria bacterium]|nr:4-hydroxy-3-methylbut-2-enyl diphosphate reductase [Candidatus Moranbacteria bacterium]
MKITIAKNAGFCFGVKRAYDLTCVNSKNCTDIYILGKLVHNDDVCEDLYKRGIKETKSIDNLEEGTIIFTAHGVGPGLYEKATNKGLKIIDTTCPKVMKAQRLAKNFAEKGFQVLLFGDKSHKEVKSIREWSNNKAKIISSLAEIKKIKLDPEKKYYLLSQTTQNVQEFQKIVDYLENKLKDFSYYNTICPSTGDRQKEIRKLARENDLVLVVGGRDSANSKRLFEIARELNKNTFFLENETEIPEKAVQKARSIAIAAGASTPEWVIEKILKKLEKIANK